MPVYNNDIDLKSHLEKLNFQVAFYFEIAYIKKLSKLKYIFIGKIL